jgi:hypothetical protein
MDLSFGGGWHVTVFPGGFLILLGAVALGVFGLWKLVKILTG